jgi:hypothetical protein
MSRRAATIASKWGFETPLQSQPSASRKPNWQLRRRHVVPLTGAGAMGLVLRWRKAIWTMRKVGNTTLAFLQVRGTGQGAQ